EIVIPLSADPQAVRAALSEALATADFVMNAPAPRVLVEAVASDGYQLTMLFWTKTRAVATAIQSLHDLTDRGLTAHGIQLDAPFRLTRTLPAPGSPSLYQDLMQAPD